MSDFNGKGGWGIKVVDGLIRQAVYNLGHVDPLGHDQVELHKSEEKDIMYYYSHLLHFSLQDML